MPGEYGPMRAVGPCARVGSGLAVSGSKGCCYGRTAFDSQACESAKVTGAIEYALATILNSTKLSE